MTYLTRGKNGELRWAEELTTKEVFKKYYPDHKKYWRDIAAEIQKFAGNTFGNILRGDKGILYREALISVCKKMKVNFNKKSKVEMIEMNLLMKMLTDSLDKMSPEELKKVVEAMGIKTTSLTPEAITAALQIAVRMGGFAAYKIAVIVANAVAKAITNRGLSLAANAGLSRLLGIFAGPIGWIVTGLWTLIDIAGPAYRVLIPAVIQVSYMRAKNAANSSQANKPK